MPELNARAKYLQLVRKAQALTESISEFSADDRREARHGLTRGKAKKPQAALTALLKEVEALLESMALAAAGPVQMTLSRSYSIAQFFAFRFVHQPRLPLAELEQNSFFGSGIYALYYIGNSFAAYNPISKTETPIYVGKADPKDSYSETTVEQGAALFKRLKEHCRSISGTDTLSLEDFEYRCATVQSGLQATVEGFMIKVFRPLWNKEVKVAFGIGKHGDAAETRVNKRSPWDTIHPGRDWADATAEDQVAQADVLSNIQKHLTDVRPFPDRDMLLKTLTEV